MEPTTIATATAALKASSAGLAQLSNAMGKGPSRLAVLVQAFAPVSVVSWFQDHRLRVRQIKAQEQMFDEVCTAIVASTRKQMARLTASPQRLQNPLARRALDELQGDMRLLGTLRQAVSLCSESGLPGITSDDAACAPSEQLEDTAAEDQTDVSWWDTFEALARRRNEGWRQGLLAKALVEYDRNPGGMALKAIWEIGMMASDDFGCLSAFCDSALHIDGKPVVLLEPEQQAKFRFEAEDKIREVNLAHAISALVDAGLVAQAATQFSTKEPVRLEHLGGPTWLIHQHADASADASHAVQINGFFVNDVALDICRLYEPKLNVASDASYKEFQAMLSSTAKERPQEMGKVRFQRRRPAAAKD